MTGVSLRLEGLTRVWEGPNGARAGVQGIDLDVPAGSFVALLGPSGCGKSTTLRMIAGLESPDAGRVLIDGQDMTHAAPAARRLSMVFQSYALFPHLSVAENILFGLKARRAPRAEQAERLTRALTLTGLQGLESRRPSALSGGQRQRVALARAVVADHPLCLMDEPLSNLDAKLRHAVRRDIRDLQRRLGMTVIYVTHDQSEAMSMADIAVLMNEGRIEQAGPPAALYETPATAFAAGFVGAPAMSLVPARALLPGAPDGARAGIRAEDLLLVPAPDAMAMAVVEDAEFLGAETFLTVRLVSSDRVPSDRVPSGPARLALRVPGRATPPAGAAAGLAWDPGALHLFDAAGKRLPVPDAPAGGFAADRTGPPADLQPFSA